MDCERFHNDLDEYATDRLPTGLRTGMQAHLAGCPDCRRLADMFVKLLSAQPTEAPPLSPDFTDRVMTGVLAARPAAGTRPSLRLRLFAAAALAAAVALAVFLP